MSIRCLYARDVNRTRLAQYVSRAKQLLHLSAIEPLAYKFGTGDYVPGQLSIGEHCDTDGFLCHVMQESRYPTVKRHFTFTSRHIWADAMRVVDPEEKCFLSLVTPEPGCMMVQPCGVFALVTSVSAQEGKLVKLRGIDCTRDMWDMHRQCLMERDLLASMTINTRFVVKVADALTHPAV